MKMHLHYLYLSFVHISSQKTYSHFWISWNKLFLGIISLKVFNNELGKLPAFPKRVQIILRKNWERELRSASARAPATFYPQTMEEVADSSEQMSEQVGWAVVQSLTWTGRPSGQLQSYKSHPLVLLSQPPLQGPSRVNISRLRELHTLLLLTDHLKCWKNVPSSSSHRGTFWSSAGCIYSFSYITFFKYLEQCCLVEELPVMMEMCYICAQSNVLTTSYWALESAGVPEELISKFPFNFN